MFFMQISSISRHKHLRSKHCEFPREYFQCERSEKVSIIKCNLIGCRETSCYSVHHRCTNKASTNASFRTAERATSNLRGRVNISLWRWCELFFAVNNFLDHAHFHTIVILSNLATSAPRARAMDGKHWVFPPIFSLLLLSHAILRVKEQISHTVSCPKDALIVRSVDQTKRFVQQYRSSLRITQKNKKSALRRRRRLCNYFFTHCIQDIPDIRQKHLARSHRNVLISRRSNF